jgi:hypothetical protein
MRPARPALKWTDPKTLAVALAFETLFESLSFIDISVALGGKRKNL